MKTSKLSLYLLIFLLGFLAVGAFYGGIALIISPDGSIFKMPVEILTNSPFSNFLIPGIVLLLVFGVLPVFVIFSMLLKPKTSLPEKLNLLNDHHYSWTFAVYIGIAQIIWIDIQTFFINSVDVIHLIYSGLGIMIVCVALLPGTRKHFIKTKK